MDKSQIIIVEDELIVARDIEQLLTRMGYEVPAIVSTGVDALKKLEKIRPSLILMDIKLRGEMSGIEAAGQIHDTLNVPIVYVTANADNEIIEQVKATEPYGFICKPVQANELRAVIELALYKHQMETKLVEHEAWLNATLQCIGDAVITTDLKGKITHLNPMAENLTGWSLSEAVGMPFSKIFKLVDKQTGKKVDLSLQKVVENRKKTSIRRSTKLIAKDGSEYQIDDSLSPIISCHGDVIGIVIVFRDVTEDSSILEALKDSEKKSRAILNHTYEFIGLLTTEGILLEANKSSLDFYGLSESDVIGKPFWEAPWWAHSVEFQQMIKNAIKKAVKGEMVREIVDHPVPDGDTRYVDFSIKPIKNEKGEIEYLVPEGRDITERILTEKALQESEELYRSLVVTSPTAIVMGDADGNLTFVNEYLAKMHGFRTSKELLNRVKNIRELVSSDSHDRLANEFQKVMRGKHSDVNEFTLIKKDGQKFPAVVSATARRDSNGDPIGFLAIALDITERKQVEDKLVENEERYRIFISQLSEGVYRLEFDQPMSISMPVEKQIDYIYDHAFIAECNTAFVKMYGADSVDDIIGKSLLDLHGSRDNPVNRETIRHFILSGHRNENIITEETDTEGNVKYFSNNAVGIIENGHVTRLWGTQTDITVRKETERALLDSEERFRSYFENSVIGIYRTNPEGEILDANPALISMLGYDSLEELQRRNLEQEGYEPGYDREGFKRTMEETGKIIGLEAVWTRKDGSPVFVRESTIATRDESNNIIYYEGTVEDISDRIEIQKALEESEKKYRGLVETSPDAIILSDLDGKVTYANQEFANLHGFDDPTEWYGKQGLDLIAPEDRDKALNVIKRIIEGGLVANVQYTFLKKDGRRFPVETSSNAIFNEDGSPQALMVISRDITERRIAEDARLLLETGIEQAAEIIIITDVEGTIQYVNPAFEKITGYLIADVIGENPKLLQSGYHDAGFYKEMWDTIQSGETWHGVFINRKKDGSEYYEKATISPVKNPSGKIINYIAVKEDITDRKKSEEALQKSEERYRAVSELTSDYAYAYQVLPNNEIVNEWVTGAFYRVSGYTREELRTFGGWEHLLYPEDKDVAADQLKSLLLNNPKTVEYRITTKEGQVRWMRDYARPIYSESEGRVTSIQGAIQDITEQKEAEQQIQKDLKEKEILLKEIHHRVKNNLQVICSLLSLQSQRIENQTALEKFEDTRNRVRSMALVHEELYQSKDFEAVDFSRYISNLAHDLFQVYAKEAGRVDLSVNVKNVFIELDRAVPCGLIISELISNSLKHAFPESYKKRGKIEIDLQPGQKEEIVLTVKDNGIGIPKDLKIEETESLGMKLLTILTEQIGGSIKLERKGGTKFTIKFVQKTS